MKTFLKLDFDIINELSEVTIMLEFSKSEQNMIFCKPKKGTKVFFRLSGCGERKQTHGIEALQIICIIHSRPGIKQQNDKYPSAIKCEMGKNSRLSTLVS